MKIFEEINIINSKHRRISMLLQPTLEKLNRLKLQAMAKALESQELIREVEKLDFQDRFGLLLDQEILDRENKKLSRLLKNASLKQEASLEDIELSTSRKLSKTMIANLSSCQWIKQGMNVMITGATGVGKSYIACALGNQACREGYSVKYSRSSRLFPELLIARGDGSYLKKIERISKINLLIIDDWGISILKEQERRDFLEIMEDRYNQNSILMVSQLPIKKWHEIIGDPTIADATLDRIVHNAYSINLSGDSFRRKRSMLQEGSKKNSSIDSKNLDCME